MLSTDVLPTPNKAPECFGWSSRQKQGGTGLQLHKAGRPDHRVIHVHLLLMALTVLIWWADHSQPAAPTSTISVLKFLLYFFIPFHADVFPLKYTSYLWSYLNNPTSASNFVFLICTDFLVSPSDLSVWRLCSCAASELRLGSKYMVRDPGWQERAYNWVCREGVGLKQP